MKKTSIDNSGNKSTSSVMFSPVDEDTHQKRMEPLELSWMNFDVCQICKDGKAIIFDAETNETLCSSCGIVLRDSVQASPELRAGAEPECQLLWHFMIWVCQLLFLIQIWTQMVFR